VISLSSMLGEISDDSEAAKWAAPP
jgi:hypothetical protein